MNEFHCESDIILEATVDEMLKMSNDVPTTDPEDVIKNPKHSNTSAKKQLINSINGAIEELNDIIGEITKQIHLKRDIKNINSIMYYSLLMLVDELDYLLQYIEKIESQIDIAVFDTAKKLNETIVNLIGHRKDILFKVIETSCKIHDYILKQKKIANDSESSDDGDSESWFERARNSD